MTRFSRWLAAVSAALVLSAGVFLPTTRAEAACVEGVASNDVLNMRAGPGTGNRIIGMIPPGACGVDILDRSGNWGYVAYQGQVGWASLRFISAGGGAPREVCVVGVAHDDVLNIRSGPGTRYGIVGIAGPGSCGIRIVGRSGNWAKVDTHEFSGWASARFLR